MSLPIGLTIAALLMALVPGRGAGAAPAVDLRFRTYYAAHQGVRMLGVPLTALMEVDGFPAQYFEKGRLEDHGGVGLNDAWAFMYGLLTRELMVRDPDSSVSSMGITYGALSQAAEGRFRVPAPPGFTGGTMPVQSGQFVPFDAQLRPASGHIVAPRFWRYITRMDLFPGGWLHDIGLPLTEARTVETHKSGESRVITYQAFERTVLTDDPRNAPEWQVERANLGTDALRSLPAAPTSMIVVPAPAAAITLPLHILAQPAAQGMHVIATLRWQDGTTIRNVFTALGGVNGAGWVVANLDWPRERLTGEQPPTQAALLELTSPSGDRLAQRSVTVLNASDTGGRDQTRSIFLTFVKPDGTVSETPSPRLIAAPLQLERAALEELLWGPTLRDGPFEGMTTAIPTPEQVLSYSGRTPDWGQRVQLKSLSITDGVARADFSQELLAYGGDVTRARLIREQITRTLTLFNTVRAVQITIQGRSDVLETGSSAIEIPAPGARVTEPLHVLARAGTPGEQVSVSVRWQDGPSISRDLPVLKSETGSGLIIGTLDWIAESAIPGPGTRAATVELRNRSNELLAQQPITVICPYDQCTQPVMLYWLAGQELQHTHRRLEKTDRILATTLEELLWGPAPANEAGFTTAIPLPDEVLTYAGRETDWGPRVRLVSLTLDGGVATANFSQELRAFGGDAMRARLIREQITRTLQQFPNVHEVRITIEGQTEPLLAP